MNMFPLTVTTPDGTVHKTCRLVHDGRTLTLWRWDGQDYVVVNTAPADQLTGTGPTWGLEDGTEIIRQEGCGCGHPLKHYTPPPTPGGARRVYTGPAS